MTQWVYGFGGGSADGDASMKNLLGGKGANLAEMSSLGLPVPPGFTVTTEACVHYYSNGQQYPDGLHDQVAAGLAKVEVGGRQDLRRCRQSAAGVGALGCTRVHAGDDGHGPEPGPERRDGRGSGRPVGRPPLRLRQLPPLHHHVFQRRPGPVPRRFRGGAGRPQGPSGRHRRHRPVRRGLGKGRRRIQGRGRARAGQALPSGSARTAVGRGRRRLRQLDERPGQILSPHARHPRKLGHGRQHPVDGVRQYGRDLGHRRGLHPQPLDRRGAAVRRVPDQRPGRGRRRRHPHAAVA